MPRSKRTCAFCEIVAGRAPARVVERDEHAICLLDINPLAPGHCLVVSRRHVAWWHDLSEEEIVGVFRMAGRVAQRLGRAFSPDFVCLYARGRRIPHTHVFLVPTRTGDVLDGVFNALERFQESPPALTALRSSAALEGAARKIRAARARGPGPRKG
jgi:histidine triad (HIT) family protein